MLEEFILSLEKNNNENLDSIFEELRKEYEWYCVSSSEYQKKRHAKNIEILAKQLASVANILYFLQ